MRRLGFRVRDGDRCMGRCVEIVRAFLFASFLVVLFFYSFWGVMVWRRVDGRGSMSLFYSLS